MTPTSFYYAVKPLIPRSFQIWARRKAALRKRRSAENVWPILEKASVKPEGWTGWPGGMRFALILTHDVETAKGQGRCLKLMDLEMESEFRSSFNFVPERYAVSTALRNLLEENGFEIGVHGLNHDGKLFGSKRIFQQRAEKINRYIHTWGAAGFRAPAMHHNLEWMHALDIEYDLSTFDTDPFEPQPDGVPTIFPFNVGGANATRGYIELPCTLPQDFTLFILLQEKGIDIWKDKLAWIAENGGMALVNTHPDYMYFNSGKRGMEEYPADYYRQFLEHVETNYKGKYWHPLPGECADWLSNANTQKERKPLGIYEDA